MQFDEVELLAPAGKWSVLEEVVQAGADAVYLGGKRLNMRMLRPEFNFSPQELTDAAKFLHDRDKKLYITINNLYYDSEIDEIREYLRFLEDIKADALILQDMAIVQICHELNLSIPLHASVQMGIGSLAAAKFLETQGFTRAILSKNLSLDEIRAIYKDSALLIEYFAHGDLCISHTGQCYMSSFMTAASGNRGSCIKPCRWKYGLEKDNDRSEQMAYFLAHNDLCLYPHLKELLEAGVRSFKIEGRMREADYVAHLVKIYRQALDRIMANSAEPTIDENEWQELHKHRIRDFTTGNLFERPDMESIGSSGEREPIFISSAFKLNRLKKDDYQNIEDMPEAKEKGLNIPKLSVKAGKLDSIQALCKLGVDSIILGCEQISKYEPGWNRNTIAEALTLVNAWKRNIKVIVETPRIVTESDWDSISELKELARLDGLNGFIVNDYGSLHALKTSGLMIYGGPGLNVSNAAAAKFLQNNGLNRLTASLELEWPRLKTLFASGNDIEVMVQGPLCGMVTDFCLPRAFSEDEDGLCMSPCLYAGFALFDDWGQKYIIRTDQKCRNYIYYPFELCLFAELPLLAASGVKQIRIDGQYYSNAILEKTVDIYLKACQALEQGKWEQEANYNNLLDIFPQGLSRTPFRL